MIRIVRFEEIDGQRVPADVAARLNLAAGDAAVLTDAANGMTLERVSAQDQLSLGRMIAARHRDALARLAK